MVDFALVTSCYYLYLLYFKDIYSSWVLTLQEVFYWNWINVDQDLMLDIAPLIDVLSPDEIVAAASTFFRQTLSMNLWGFHDSVV